MSIKKIYANQDRIIKILVRDIRVEMQYQPYSIHIVRGFWGQITSYKRGFETTFYPEGCELLSFENAKKRYIIKNGVLYKKPKVTITYTHGDDSEYEFETLDEALDYAKSLSDGLNIKLVELWKDL